MSHVSIEEILELPAAQRVELAQQIWESVHEHPDTLPLTAAQKAELERRWTAFQQAPEAGDMWEEVRDSLLRE